MWNLKTAQINHQYESTQYSGPAIKLGSGVIVGDAYKVASEAGYWLVVANVGV